MTRRPAVIPKRDPPKPSEFEEYDARADEGLIDEPVSDAELREIEWASRGRFWPSADR